MLTLPALRGFVALIDEGSFSAAAARLGVSQPAVSAQLRTLEEHFGRALVERSGRTWRPTPAGERLYRHAVDLSGAIEQMEDSLREAEEPGGKLRVAASTVPGEFLLPRLLKGFCERYPAVGVKVEVADSSSVADQLLRHRCDLGVIGARLAPDRLDLTPFASDELLLVAPPGHPLARGGRFRVKDLAGHPFVLREEGSGTRSVISAALMDAGFDPASLRVAIELGSTEAVKQAVEGGIGLSFISCYALRPGEVPGRIAVVDLAGLRSKRPLFVALESSRAPRRAAEALRDYLVSKEVVALLKDWRSAWKRAASPRRQPGTGSSRGARPPRSRSG